MNVVAYCRVSTDKEDQLNSLEAQKKFFEEYTNKNGYKLLKIYSDELAIIRLNLRNLELSRGLNKSYFLFLKLLQRSRFL